MKKGIRFRLQVKVEVKGANRAQPLHTFPPYEVVGSSLLEWKQQLFETVKSHIRGSFTKPNQVPVLSPHPEGGVVFNNFKDFVKIDRRGKKFFLSTYSEEEIRNDMNKGGFVLPVTVFQFGSECSVPDFKALTNHLRAETDRAGAPEEAHYRVVTEQLKERQSGRWTTKHVANWGLWAALIVSRSKREGNSFEQLLTGDPPPCYAHLFYRPGSDAETFVRDLREASKTFVRLTNTIEERVKTQLQMVIETCRIYRELLEGMGDETLNLDGSISEPPEALAIANQVINQPDVDHQ